jgi:hypothetical protein
LTAWAAFGTFKLPKTVVLRWLSDNDNLYPELFTSQATHPTQLQCWQGVINLDKLFQQCQDKLLILLKKKSVDIFYK